MNLSKLITTLTNSYILENIPYYFWFARFIIPTGVYKNRLDEYINQLGWKIWDLISQALV